jgi:hypothetical protein
VYFALDEYGEVHLVTRTGSGFALGDDGYEAVATLTGATSLTVADPTNLVTFEKLGSDTGEALVGVTYRIEGAFADGSKVQDVSDAGGAAMMLDRLLVSGNTYTITELVAPARYKRDRAKRAFTIDNEGVVTFVGDAGGYSTERVFDESLGQWVSVIRQLDDLVDTRTPSSSEETDGKDDEATIPAPVPPAPTVPTPEAQVVEIPKRVSRPNPAPRPLLRRPMRPVPLAPTGDATDAHTALMLALLGTLALLASRRKRVEQ